MADDRTLEALTTLWESRGITVDALILETDGTVADACSRPAPEVDLPLVLVHGDSTGGDELELGRTIGEGGMGVILAAQQVSLDREVAVKRVRAENVRVEALRELVREARITGALEHPNIVPIHALGRDQNGAPLLVMKRIEGVVWSSCIAETDLDRNLDTIIDVCKAVHFAHSRGVVHRDLKPENVMIGTFGEVYVLDWGLSVAIDERLADRMPLAREVDSVAGTPAFLAPEMAAGEGARIGVRSDVYLLGSILHECITGRPRHGGKSVRDTLLQAWLSAPVDYGPSVPAELAEICNRATHLDPEQRFESAEALREAIQDYRLHSSSRELARETGRRLDALRVAAGTSEPGEKLVVRTLFSECRFGFQQALSTWPGNRSARDGLEEALGIIAGWELERGLLGSAAAHIGDMRAPSAPLQARLKEAQERQTRLEDLDRQLDPTIGTRTRAFVALIQGVVFGVLPFVLGYLDRAGTLEFTYPIYVVSSILWCAVIAWIAHWARETLQSTQVNRQITAALAYLALPMLVLPAGTWLLGLPATVALVVLMLLVAVVFGVLGATVERGLLVPTAIWFAGFLFASARPQLALYAFSGTICAASLVIAWIWRPRAGYSAGR